MKLKIRKHTAAKKTNRLKKKIRIRKTVKGTPDRPRLCVYRSSKHIYAQIINDLEGHTIITVSSLESDNTSGLDQAKSVGAQIAQLAISKNIKKVVFDRNGYLYHGRIKSLAEGARENGLSF